MNLLMRSSRIALGLGLGVGLCLGLASCNDNDGMKDRTVTSVARSEIARNSTETDDPILLNDLPLSGRDTSETIDPSTD